MITQGIKRWLKNLFAWWTRGLAPASNHPQTTGTTVQGTTQEALFFTTTEGPHVQPTQAGITSVAIEPFENEPISDNGFSSPTNPTFPPKLPATNPPSVEENNNPPPTLEGSQKTQQAATDTTTELPIPTPEQRLEFLRYLVERGIVNEGHTKRP